MSVPDRRARLDRCHAKLSVRRQCRLLGLARSGVYRQRQPANDNDLGVMRRLDELFTQWPFLGSRRLAWMLWQEDQPINRKRVQRLMRLMGLEAVYPKPNLSMRGAGHKVYPYLLRGVSIERVNQVWSTEIVYSQMTKPAGLAGRPDRERVTDLDIVPGYNDPVDEQLDQLPLPLECCCVESVPHPFRERFRRMDRAAQLECTARLSREFVLLFRQRAISAL